MKVPAVILLSFITYLSCSPVAKKDVRSRLQSGTDNVVPLECDETGPGIIIKSEEGVYAFTSPGGSQVCGVYIITEPDYLVEFEFHEFDITCSKGGLLSAIDGWELNGQFFPSDYDHPKPPEQRFSEYCGSNKPWKALTTSQNVGVLEFRVPIRGEGFTVSVRFKDNPKPCNAVLQQPIGVYTLRNYGRKANCSISLIFPESFQILATSIGTQTLLPVRNMDIETGLIRKCKKRGMDDFVEIRGGDGLDPNQMVVIDDFCGLSSMPSKKVIDVPCGNTAIRLVSSGRFENSVTISYDVLLDDRLICPKYQQTL